MFFVSLHSTGGLAVGEAPEAKGPRQFAQEEVSGSHAVPLLAETGMSKAASKRARRADLVNVCR